jgi:hypothetical protein
MSKYFSEAVKRFGLSGEETEFLKQVDSAFGANGTTEHLSASTKIISEMVLGNKVVASANTLIESNRRLAETNEVYTKSIVRLTAALVVVAILDLILRFCFKL